MNRNRVIYFLIITVLVGCSTAGRHASHNVFRYNESKGITSLDPAFARTMPSIWPVSQIFCGLVQLDSALQVKPCVAKRWSISADGLTYTFSLRNDVFFQNDTCFVEGKGRRVTSNDFVYSIDRLGLEEVASPGAWILSKIDTLKDGEPAIIAQSDTVLAIRLREPFPAFLGLLTSPYCSVVPREAIARYGRDFGHHPVGCGPFQLKVWRDGEKLVLVKNPNYFEVDKKGIRLPYLDAVSISFIGDKQSEFMEFILGNLDFISGVSKASKDELLTRTGQLNPKYANRVQMETGPFLNTEYLGVLVDPSKLQPQQSVLLKKEFRRAIAFGINKAKMITYLRNGLGYPANSGFIPQGLPPYNPNFHGLTYCPDSTLAILARMGYPHGDGLPAVTLTTTDDYLDLCEFIQHELSVLGIKINVEVATGASYRQAVMDSRLPFFRGSWIADYADAESYLSLFYSKNYSPYGPNYTHYSNSLYDKLYVAALKTADIKLRFRFYSKMDSIITNEAPVIPLFYDKAVRFVRLGIKGMAPNPMNIPVFKYVQIGKK
ncbi:MAG TPA: ABC transporter substrate-binding protein [Williamwhitmania sp.]|nr:ABC transporter substrate-binding protein [Williamwhitmania sp.]